MPIISHSIRLVIKSLFFSTLLLSPIGICVAEKVALDPSNWGIQEGEACVACHQKASAGLAHEWQTSAHAKAGVNCLDCHLANQVEPDAIEHEGSVISVIVSPKDCGRCHVKEFKESAGSVHSKALSLIENRIPALADNLTGKEMVAAGCAQCHGSKVQVKGDGTLTPETWPNTGIGRINPDGSVGSCSACHGRHNFSKAQARDPSACTWCHTGPESPDDEVFASSKHGMLYAANQGKMNLESDDWVLGKDYSAAPTCVTCHMGATPSVTGSHDVGMRDAWNLNRPVSDRQHLVIFDDGDRREMSESESPPKRGSELNKLDGSMGKVTAVASPDRRRQIMSQVCLECHAKGFVQGFMNQFDGVIDLYNEKFGKPAQAIMHSLYGMELLTPAPFDEPLEFIYWRLWHDEGTRARHGAAMMSPNQAWWEGMHRVSQTFYEEFLPQIKQLVGKEKADALFEKHLPPEHHAWLKQPNKPNPILGYGIGRASHD